MPPYIKAAADVYSEELATLGHGRAMWHPEPVREQGDIEIGDVGFVEADGWFRRLFNITKGLDDPMHQRNEFKTPPNFQKLKFHSNLALPIPHSLSPGVYTSRSIETRSIDLTASAGSGSAGAGASLSYSCSKNTGALLYLKDDATKQECSPNKSWRKYIIENIDNWKTYLEESDFDISIEQLMIVRGFVKTSSWEAVAWTQSTGSHTFSIAASAAGHAGVNGSISNTHETRTTPVYRRWPTTSIASNQLQDAQQSLLHDQTIFLRYYCIRRRNWFQMWLEKTKIDAGAGYHNLPPPSPGAGSGGVAYVESDAQPEWDDPLNDAFRYLFEHNTTADIACVCDGDINCLFPGSGWPSDLYQSLVELTPQIEVIGKIAVFSIEEMIRKTHNLGAPGAVPFVHPQDLPEDGDSSMGEVSQPPEDIRGGSITIAEDQRTLEWPHTVLMDRKANGGTPCQAAISKDGQYVAVGYEDTGIRLWHVDREEPEYILRGHGDVVQCVDFSPDGQVLASGSDDSTIILWDIHSGLQLQQIFDDSLGTLSTTFSPDGKILITGSQDPSLKFWDMETITSGVHEPFAIHSDFSSSVQAVAFTPDSSRAISCSDQQGRIWESQSGELIHTMEGHEGTIWALAVSHNGARAATGSEDHTARIWSVQTGEELVTIREHRGAIWSVKFSPDDRWVIAGSYDSTISISRTSTGECLHILSGHTSVVHAVAYSPVGDLVASGAADGTVKLWDGKHGKAIAEMKGHADKIKSLRFSPNCDDLFSSSDDGTVRGWSTLDVLRIA